MKKSKGTKKEKVETSPASKGKKGNGRTEKTTNSKGRTTSKSQTSKARASKEPSSKRAPAPKNKNTAQANAKADKKTVGNYREQFPEKFPFWARLKISKKRTTLVIDEEDALNKHTKKMEAGFVHREATHTEKKEYEKIDPNPDGTDSEAMYLKRPQKLPQKMFEPHNKKLDMPKHLKERYEKNNK